MIHHYKTRPKRVRIAYRDIMTEIYRQHGHEPFHASDLLGIDFRVLMTLKTSNYIVVVGSEPYGELRRVVNIYKINPCYISHLKTEVENY